MILVIMGAGASFDSIPGKSVSEPYDNRPPLADSLFEEYYLSQGTIESFGRCLAIVPFLKNTQDGKSLEQKLEEYQQQADSYPERHKQLAGLRFYLQYMLSRIDEPWYTSYHQITNHLTLIDQIWEAQKNNVKAKICFVTFNYDRLIELTLGKHRVRFNTMDNYVSDDKFLLFKLHGSVNWKRRIIQWPAEIQDHHGVIEYANRLQFSDDFEIINNPLEVQIKDYFFYPAISIPVLTKSKFECPPMHLQRLQQVLPQTKLIIVVGWRGAEMHFVEILKQYVREGTSALVVAGNKSDAISTIENIKKSGVSLDFTTSDKGFSGAILAREIFEFVRSSYNSA